MALRTVQAVPVERTARYNDLLIDAARNLFAYIGTFPPHVFGQTCFRDNIEDEWLIVYLLFKLSEHFVDLVIRQVAYHITGTCTFI